MKEGTERRVAAVIGVLTLLATVVASIPAFMEFLDKRPAVVFDAVSLPVLNRQSPDYEKLQDLLKNNKIADSRLRVRIANRGSGPSSSVRVTTRFSGSARSLRATPSEDDRPAWIRFSQRLSCASGDKTVYSEFSEFGVGPVLQLDYDYDSAGKPDDQPTIELYSNGVAAEKVPDVMLAQEVGWFHYFARPFAILGTGVGLIALVVVVFLVQRNPMVAVLLRDAVRLTIESMVPWSRDRS